MNTELPNFRRVVRGYDPEAVETAWAELEHQITEVNATNKELRLQINSLREQNAEWRNRIREFEEVEKDLRDAMISAQRIAGQVKEDAEVQAKELMESARFQAETILNEARAQTDEKINQVNTLLLKKQSEIEQLESELSSLTIEKQQLEDKVTRVIEFLQSAQSILAD